MSFVANGKNYSGAAGYDYKTAARDIYNSGKSFDPHSSNVDPYTSSLIQKELNKLDYTRRW